MEFTDPLGRVWRKEMLTGGFFEVPRERVSAEHGYLHKSCPLAKQHLLALKDQGPPVAVISERAALTVLTEEPISDQETVEWILSQLFSPPYTFVPNHPILSRTNRSLAAQALAVFGTPHTSKAPKPEKPEKLEKPEKPEKLEKPESPKSPSHLVRQMVRVYEAVGRETYVHETLEQMKHHPIYGDVEDSVWSDLLKREGYILVGRYTLRLERYQRLAEEVHRHPGTLAASLATESLSRGAAELCLREVRKKRKDWILACLEAVHRDRGVFFSGPSQEAGLKEALALFFPSWHQMLKELSFYGIDACSVWRQLGRSKRPGADPGSVEESDLEEGEIR
ncbi:hypothetical protein NEDG_00178 [Nematocida displodere]|uniref:Uncharacterized protein n=1 Tax=Nematocida displodere TaxID=1805483 RepID=A0A177EIA0_9MICR|nr:hypothetical protein NEDG_00178 [Nematocida displodere]